MNSEFTLLHALQRKDEKAIRYVYWDYFASVRRYVVLNNGSDQDAEDLFQEAVLILLSKISEKDFTLSSSVKTFLFAISKRLWWNQLKKKNTPFSADFYDISQSDFLEEEEKIVFKEAKWNSMQVVLAQITQYCSKLLKEMFLDGKASSTYKNAHTLHNQKYKCLIQAKKAAAKIKSLNG
jgi:DNA-directed RNA polymerase specialized sigma24 family protein